MPNAARWNVFKVTVFFYLRVIVSLTVHVSRTSVQLCNCVCVFLSVDNNKKKQCRVKRHCLKSTQVCRTCCKNFNTSPKTHLPQILQNILVSYPHCFIFFLFMCELKLHKMTHAVALWCTAGYENTRQLYTQYINLLKHRARCSIQPWSHSVLYTDQFLSFSYTPRRERCGLCWPRPDQKWCIAGAASGEL